MAASGSGSALVRPAPLPLAAATRRIDGNTPYRDTEALLAAGCDVVLGDTWGTALTLQAWLRRRVRRSHPAHDYASHRAQRARLWQLTRHLLVPITAHRVALRRAPPIPWLERLYPEADAFLLPLPDVLGLNGAWQWYRRGLRYPVLDAPLHPFYGVYFTPRAAHVQLFDTWLAERSPPAGTVVDVGVGCGALTFLLLQHGVPRVHATDTNPNALVSVAEDLARQDLTGRVQLEGAPFLGRARRVDWVVCNPPWLPGDPVVPLDRGNTYPADWFARFFAGADDVLSGEGRVVLLFSNFARLAGLTDDHPLENELARERRFRLVERREAPAPPSSARQPPWRRQLNRGERVELWELVRRGSSTASRVCQACACTVALPRSRAAGSGGVGPPGGGR